MSVPHEDVATVPIRPSMTNLENSPDLLQQLSTILSSGCEGIIGRLGHYDVLEIVGQGGFGIVVKARDQSLQRLVAIKIMAPRLAVTSPPRKFFLREARAAAKVRHENVVQVHGVGETPLPYLVMEYIEGKTLQDRLDREGPLDSEEAVRIGRQIALGLAAAHATGLIHRDIKPANILLENDTSPRVKITDFGIARTADDAKTTQSGYVVGTPMYMAPEQVNGDEIDQRADLFSLGSVLYTMVSGRPPFRAPTAMGILKRVVDDTPRPIQQVNPGVNAGLCAVIARLHAKAPANRFASAAEVADALESCLTHAPAARRRRRATAVWAGAIAAVILIAAVVRLSPDAVAPSNPAAPGPAMNTATSATITTVEATPPSQPSQTVPSATSKKLPSGSPVADWENAVASMPVGDQVPAVNAKLRVLNPDYDDAGLTYRIENRQVTSMTILSPDLVDLSPLRALRHLRELRIAPRTVSGELRSSKFENASTLRGLKLESLSLENSLVSDLTPLIGMPLKRLNVWGFRGDDLGPLRRMQLDELNCGHSNVHDLSPLRGMPLTNLCLNLSKVSDLSPLAGMKLSTLMMEHTAITDISLLWSMPLELLAVRGSKVGDLSRVRELPIKHLLLDFDPARDVALLRSISTLEMVNHQPLQEFLTGSD